MSVIAVYSIKGGVGKTTIAFDLAWRAARKGMRTLLWDLDLQGGAGFLLDEELPRIPRAVSAFRPDGLLRRLVRPTRYANLFHLPADESLRVLPNELSRLREKRRLTGLTQLLSGEFSWIVLDCPPAMNEVSDQIISAADLIVVPLPPSPLAMRAIEAVQTELRRNHPDPPPLYPVLSMVDLRRKLHRQTVLGAGLIWPVIPLSSDIERVALNRAPISVTAPGSAGSRALADLHCRIEEQLANLPPRKLTTLQSRSPIRTAPAATPMHLARPDRSPRHLGGGIADLLRWLLRV